VLDTLLADGTVTRPSKHPAPARVAPPTQLAFLNTLIIHPSYTSRASEPTNLHVAARALAYLRGVLEITGPIHANLRYAFTFNRRPRRDGRDSRSTSRYHTRYSSPPLHDDEANSSDSDNVEGRLANEQSVWQGAGNFWTALGWAFRCAAAHPERWRHWKVWLEYMVDVLEKDWDERFALDAEQNGVEGSQSTQAGEWKMLNESLLVAYFDDLHRGGDILKGVLRALMAFTDDDPIDKGTYREVFERELAVITGNSKRKRAATTGEPEMNQLGSLMDWAEEDDLEESEDDEDDDEFTSRPSSPSIGKKKSARVSRGKKAKQAGSSPSAAIFRVTEGMADSVSIRLRIFRLLSAAACYIPERFCPLADLYDKFADRVCNLPLAMFRPFIDSLSSISVTSVYVSLYRRFAERLLPNNCPDPSDVDSSTDEADGLSFDLLGKCFLPFAASRVMAEDNAKLSLILESMLWFIYQNSPVTKAEATRLGKAAEKGIKAREERIKKRNANVSAADREAREVLQRSARSMRIFIQVAGGDSKAR